MTQSSPAIHCSLLLLKDVFSLKGMNYEIEYRKLLLISLSPIYRPIYL